MEKWLSAEQVAEMLDMTPRSARAVMGEIGVTTVRHRPYVSQTALERYLSDRTPATFYNQGVAPYPTTKRREVRK